jgi:uncharacterized membrane protein
MTKRSSHGRCSICQRQVPTSDLTPIELVRPGVVERIRADHPDLGPGDAICREDLNRYRAAYVTRMLEEERGELSEIEEEVIRKLSEQEIVSENVNTEFDERASLGQRLADRVAAVGGSWGFVIGFFTFLLAWMAINSAVLLSRAFDPYPFILLNLVLSCLAAIQAPIIMMSQNRQEAKDRLSAEHDYRVNLKAELEIRLIGERVDRLLNHQWQRLLEIQEIQVELMEQLGTKGR